MRLLILGGTTEASRLAAALAGRSDIQATLSLAGRTEAPAPSPLPRRIGGFGGVAGLVEYLRTEAVDRVIDATHPFAARMTRHAVEACAVAGVPLLALTRAPWTPGSHDRWHSVSDIAGAVTFLAERPPTRVFLTTGRNDLAAFHEAPQHHYLVRSIDPPVPGAHPPDMAMVLDRGPFGLADEMALMRRHTIALLVTKNSGGDASAAKLAAAWRLGCPVLMVRRPAVPPCQSVTEVAAALAWLATHAPPA